MANKKGFWHRLFKKHGDTLIIICIGILMISYSFISQYINKEAVTEEVEEHVEIVELEGKIPDLTINQNIQKCESQNMEEPYNKFLRGVNNCKIDIIKERYETPILVMSGATTPTQLTAPTIIGESSKFTVSGEIAELYMYVKAGVSDKQHSTNRKNSIYFYMNSGDNGGFLNSYRLGDGSSEVSNITFTNQAYNNQEGIFLSQNTPIEYRYKLHENIFISNHKGTEGVKSINYKSKIRTEGVKNYVYAYVSKPTYGEIYELSFLYSCKGGKGACEIKLVD